MSRLSWLVVVLAIALSMAAFGSRETEGPRPGDCDPHTVLLRAQLDGYTFESVSKDCVIWTETVPQLGR